MIRSEPFFIEINAQFCNISFETVSPGVLFVILLFSKVYLQPKIVSPFSFSLLGIKERYLN